MCHTLLPLPGQVLMPPHTPVTGRDTGLDAPSTVLPTKVHLPVVWLDSPHTRLDYRYLPIPCRFAFHYRLRRYLCGSHYNCGWLPAPACWFTFDSAYTPHYTHTTCYHGCRLPRYYRAASPYAFHHTRTALLPPAPYLCYRLVYAYLPLHTFCRG